LYGGFALDARLGLDGLRGGAGGVRGPRHESGEQQHAGAHPRSLRDGVNDG
jgi:hypothetical protein